MVQRDDMQQWVMFVPNVCGAICVKVRVCPWILHHYRLAHLVELDHGGTIGVHTSMYLIDQKQSVNTRHHRDMYYLTCQEIASGQVT